MEVLEGDYISNRAIASWLFSRVNRRLENATDEADRVILTDALCFERRPYQYDQWQSTSFLRADSRDRVVAVQHQL